LSELTDDGIDFSVSQAGPNPLELGALNELRYGVPAALSESGEYPYILGTGNPEERMYSIVATSLAMAQYFGAVM